MKIATYTTKGLYWNDVPEVYKYMCKNFTGDENIWWVEDFKGALC